MHKNVFNKHQMSPDIRTLSTLIKYRSKALYKPFLERHSRYSSLDKNEKTPKIFSWFLSYFIKYDSVKYDFSSYLS